VTAVSTPPSWTAPAQPSSTPGDASFFARQEHFPSTTSTNDVVAGWLAEGTREVALATADEQTHGRGREQRTWQAPPGSSLLLSLGFRPTWLAADQVWRLAAVIALAMADAAEEVAGLSDGVIRLKWPNDLVVEFTRDGPAGDEEDDDSARAKEVRNTGSTAQQSETRLRKLAGVLGETSGLGTDDPRAIVGIGINADWRREDFPTDLADTMTSLRDASGGRPVDRVQLLDAFLGRIEMRVDGLRKGHFALSDWQERQITTRRLVDLVGHDGNRQTVLAVGVDDHSGGLVVEDDGRDRIVHSGEILHVRLAGV
jgi:BirA family biotin operon repressor/biotin-[acetyl-CoA-carboxylase] ligase